MQCRLSVAGTLDDTAFCALPTALAFCRSMGGLGAVSTYNHDLVGWAAQMLVKAWGTELLAPLQKCTAMACVRVPFEQREGEDLFGLIWWVYLIFIYLYR